MVSFKEQRFGWDTAERYANDVSFPFTTTLNGPSISAASSTSAVSVMLPKEWRGKYIRVSAMGCDTRVRLDSNKGVAIASTESAIAGSDLDRDGLIASTASPDVDTTYTTFGGAVTAALLKATPRHVTLFLSNHANWDATTAYFYGRTDGGIAVSEAFAIPDGGNTTLTTRFIYSERYALFIPAQAGTSGAFELGVADSLTRTIAGTEPHTFIPAGGFADMRLQDDRPGTDPPTNPPAASSGIPGHHWLTHIDSATGGFLFIALATGAEP
jgi:hypothetical protein